MARRPLLRRFETWGLLFGGLLTLWLVFLPAALGERPWFWFDFGALADDLDLVLRAPALPFAGAGVVYWLVAAALLPAGFALCWKALRAREVGLEHELALARRRAEHRALFAESEALWQAVEAAEQAGDAPGQVAAVDAWIAHARRVELTADLAADRVERLRAMARAVGPSEPDAAVRLLEEAKALSTARSSAAIGRWPAMRGDLARYALAAGLALLGVPLLLLPVALVMWMLNMILAILAVAAVIAIVLVIMGAS